MSEGLLKNAYPVWMHIPGTPFTLPGRPQYRERLTGMNEWAPREMVERVGEGLEEGRTVEDLVRKEKGEGLLGHLGVGALGGAAAGGVAGRLAGGEAAVAPFKGLLEKGVSLKGLKNLGKIPMASKLLPALGVGAGLLGGAALWKGHGNKRESQAREVARGLTAERILQRNALREAIKGESPYTQPLLRGLPLTSASAQTPYAVTLSNAGL